MKLLSGSVSNSFAYYTIKDRIPVTLTKIIDRLSKALHSNSQLSTEQQQSYKEVIEKISRLKYELARDYRLPSLPVNDDDAFWNDLIGSISDESRSWFKAPWLIIECYVYRLINQYIQESPSLNQLDVFATEKQSALAMALPAIHEFYSHVESSEENGSGVLHDLILGSLWGNQCDLSLLVRSDQLDDIQLVTNKTRLVQRMHNVIINDTSKLVEYMLSLGATGLDKVVTIVLDNAGFEIVCDLLLADYLMRRVLDEGWTVKFQTKQFPWFVSDTTQADVEYTLDTLQSQNAVPGLVEAVARWKAWVATGRWSFDAHWFWTSGFAYWSMKEKAPDLHESLRKSSLVLFKGDLNYRKMVHDADWPYETPIGEAIGPINSAKWDEGGFGPFCLIRTCKSDTICGLSGDLSLQLDSVDKDWLTNGKFGVVQFYQ